MMKHLPQQPPRLLLLLVGIIVLSLPGAIAEEATEKVSTPKGAVPTPCPHIPDYTAPYHEDSACDKMAQNKFMDSLDRVGQRHFLQSSGIQHVPDRMNVVCPVDGIPQDLFRHFTTNDPTYHYGFDRVWIVHNKASHPVVISWIDPNEKHGSWYQEKSAFDASITPPHHDPHSILKSGEWKSMYTYDGHVFHVRRLEADGSLGRILMQHRVGLIPIQNVFGHAIENYCNPNDPDVEPVVKDNVEQTPKVRRSLRTKPQRPCNIQDIGFRNLVGCPLNVYYSGLANVTGIPRAPGEDCSFTPKSCHEQFKYHLGKNPYSDDFVGGWDSQTKFADTYFGHNFVFRLEAKDEIVVDSVTVEPTSIYDCPGQEEDEIKKDGYLASLHPKHLVSNNKHSKVRVNRLHDMLQMKKSSYLTGGKEEKTEEEKKTLKHGARTPPVFDHPNNDYDDGDF